MIYKYICRLLGHKIKFETLAEIPQVRLPEVIIEKCLQCGKRISVKTLDGHNYLTN